MSFRWVKNNFTGRGEREKEKKKSSQVMSHDAAEQSVEPEGISFS